jgi:hypothetical protein
MPIRKWRLAKLGGRQHVVTYLLKHDPDVHRPTNVPHKGAGERACSPRWTILRNLSVPLRTRREYPLAAKETLVLDEVEALTGLAVDCRGKRPAK